MKNAFFARFFHSAFGGKAARRRRYAFPRWSVGTRIFLAFILATTPLAAAQECPLCDAAKNGNTAEVQRLLANGADVNKYGWTALMGAALKGHAEIAKILLANGADVNAVDKGDWTALIWVANKGYHKTAKILLDNGANVNVVNRRGSQYNIGWWYYEGKLGAVNKREAFRWFRKAAMQGYMKAQRKLGLMYWQGEGVIENEYESYIWHAIAKANGDIVSKIALRENNWRNYLTAAQIQQAKGEAERRLAAIESGKGIEKETAPAGEVAAAPPPKSANNAGKVFENAWRSIVVIKTADAQGSGVIVRPNIVATNCHVLEDGGEIKIYKHDNRRASTDTLFSATIRKRDSENDFCLLDVSGLWGIPAGIRKYNTLKIGEDVYALGSPEGLDLSLSSGLISQLREVKNARYIQTDAAISPGSSGGGLFDSDGNLIGILTSKIADEDVEGIGFAIPADLALNL